MEIPMQIESIPDDATHLVLSVGGNDALIWRNELLSTKPALDALTLLRKAQREFEQSYGEAVDAAISTGLPLEVCTIYKHIPGLPDILQAPLGVFNDVITQTINGYGNIGLIDLRYICTEPEDYSDMSPIEPSAKGGMKIAKAIVNRLLDQQIKQPDHTSMNAENRQNR